MKLLPYALVLLTAACAAQVSHPSKNDSEMRADIKLCTHQANHKYWMDPIAALYNAYDCLEAKGYQRDRIGLSGEVERGVNQGKAKPKAPALPCRVPCRRQDN